MAQLTLYLDEDTRRRIETAAKEAKISVSRWVKERLHRALETEWPPHYFELFGILADGDLERPAQLPHGSDHQRESLDP